MKWSYDAALLLVDYLYYSQNHTINQCNRAAENLAYCLTANSGVTEDDGTAIGYRFVLAYIQSFNVTKEDLRSIWGKIDGLTKEVYLLSETKYEVFQQQVALAKEAFAFSEYGSQVEQQLSPTEPIEIDTPAEDISYSKQLGIPADAFTEMKLEELDLSARGFHLLKRAGAKTVSDVLLFTPSQLMQMKGLGNGTFNEIEKKLSSLQNDMTVSKQKASFADISICKAHAAEICTGDFTWVEQKECSDLQLDVIEDYKEAYDILGADLSFKAYSHDEACMSFNSASTAKALNIEAHMIYPEVSQTFWSLVIGLGYPTPEPPGFRWCTERLKLNPSNAFTYNTIKNDGEVIILLGVRKAESAARSRSISSHEIEGKILTPHNQISKAYVYSPLANIKNELVWEYLLKDDGLSAWGTDNKYLFSLYQGENLGEEQSVVGEVDKDKIPVTGNSRFGCWVCTMVKEDKSLKNFIDHGAKELIPLRDFRNWLVELRSNREARDYRRRNGSVYLMSNGEYGRGPFTMAARKEILRRLLLLEVETGYELITLPELKCIDKMWEDEGDLSRRALVDLYYEVKGKHLPWDSYKQQKYDDDIIAEVERLCDMHDVPFDLMSKLMIAVDNSKFYTRSAVTTKEIDKILNQGWLHFEAIKEGLENENNAN